jgi:hypothetical protein
VRSPFKPNAELLSLCLNLLVSYKIVAMVKETIHLQLPPLMDFPFRVEEILPASLFYSFYSLVSTVMAARP